MFKNAIRLLLIVSTIFALTGCESRGGVWSLIGIPSPGDWATDLTCDYSSEFATMCRGWSKREVGDLVIEIVPNENTLIGAEFKGWSRSDGDYQWDELDETRNYMPDSTGSFVITVPRVPVGGEFSLEMKGDFGSTTKKFFDPDDKMSTTTAYVNGFPVFSRRVDEGNGEVWLHVITYKDPID